MNKLITVLFSLFVSVPCLAATNFTHYTGTSAPSGWTAVTAGNGVVCMNGTIVAGSGGTCPGATTGETRLSLVSAATTDAAALYTTSTVSRTVNAIYWFDVRAASSLTGRIMLVDKTTPVADTTANITGSTGYVVALVQVGASTGTQVRLNRYNNARNQTDGVWNDGTKTWTNNGTDNAMATDTDNYSEIGFEIDGTNLRWRLHGCGNYDAGSTVPDTGLYCPLLTDWTDFSYAEGGGGFCNPNCNNLRFVLGDLVNNNDTTSFNVEYSRVDEGTTQYSWANARNSGGNWLIYPFYGYPGPNGYVERFVLVDRGVTIAINTGGAGSWKEQHVKDPHVTLGSNGTYYMCYSGSRVSDGKFQVGFATASSPLGTWTDGANNPIVALVAGTTEDQLANCLFIEDLTQPDPVKRWVMIYEGIDTSSPLKRNIYAKYCSAPPDNVACDSPGEWSAKIELLAPGTAGAIDDLGTPHVWPVLYGGNPYFITSLKKNGGGLTGSYAYNKNFLSAFTKSGVTTLTGQTSNCNTTATNSFSTATRVSVLVGSTAGCIPDQYVIIDDDSSAANGHLARILNVEDSTHLTFYNLEQGHNAGATIKGTEAFLDIEIGWPQFVKSGLWVSYGTCFSPFSGGNPDFYIELVCTYTGPSPIGPWTRAELATPIKYTNPFGMQHSLENSSFVFQPFRRSTPFIGPR